MVRRVKKKLPWIAHLIDEGSGLTPVVTDRGQRCVACKGAKMLCGKRSCPLLLRLNTYLKMPALGRDVDGSSPPGIFVGRLGYPYVYVGPLVPPIHADTSLYDEPERWFGLGMEEIAGFRMMLVRGKQRVNVKKAAGPIVDAVQEMVLSTKPVDVEMRLSKKPTGHLVLDDGVQPVGPSAPLLGMELTPGPADQRIERAYNDTDLVASEAVFNLYQRRVAITKIQRALSGGMFGLAARRRLVPTRWSITAVDSIVAKRLMRGVREAPFINECRVYESSNLDNRFEILMVPDTWSYESMEAWYPGTIWNPRGRETWMLSDVEGYGGRKQYASMGGCYYAARLAVCEHLTSERRQARVVVLREAHPGYVMPMGVWNVRESVRNALQREPLRFDTLGEALSRIWSRLDIPKDVWVKNSQLLADTTHQQTVI